MTALKNLLYQMKANKTITLTSLIISVIYGMVYYWSTGYASITSRRDLSWIHVNNWQEQSLKLRAPFLWEPVAQLNLPIGLNIQLAPVNIALSLVLVLLVYTNIFIFVLSIKEPKVCKLTSKKQTVFALLPALFTGFTCCAPTFIIAFIGIVGTSASSIILITRWAIPFSLILLIYGAIKGSRTIVST